jgi:hypothetical protein
VADTIARRRAADRVRPGDVVAIAAGSRGISNHDEIVRSVARELLARGAKPFIFPAMGSHGGATAEGQRDLLAGYGITEEAMGVPVVSSMETVQVGVTPHGLPVRIAAPAAAADWIVPVGRVKPHTDFRGRHESGLIKMLAIGCGKQYGANICHMQGFPHMARNIWEIAKAVLAPGKVLFGLAILEDASHGTWSLTAVPGEHFDEEDALLLEEAKALVPRIPFEKIDLLVLSEIGKDISGASMDPNVTGRSAVMGASRPFAERIVALDLTDASHHNATGVGNADITTRSSLTRCALRHLPQRHHQPRGGQHEDSAGAARRPQRAAHGHPHHRRGQSLAGHPRRVAEEHPVHGRLSDLGKPDRSGGAHPRPHRRRAGHPGRL